MKGWLGELDALVHFANGEEIKDWVDEEMLPRYIGGTCDKNFTAAPEGVPTVHDAAPEYGLTPQEVTKYLAHYQDLLDEAEKL